MTNGEIKLVVKALCIALGDEDRHYTVKVDDNGIEIGYIAAEVVDSNPDPQTARDTEYEYGHYELPLISVLNDLVEEVKKGIEEIESVGIEYKRF